VEVGAAVQLLRRHRRLSPRRNFSPELRTTRNVEIAERVSDPASTLKLTVEGQTLHARSRH
jgi:hypothetical protein